jgi:hypothetical protein
MARVLIADADGRRSRLKMSPDSYVWQRFSRVERVMGIEPALSAWELLELMGVCLVLCEFRGPEGLECPLDACRYGKEPEFESGLARTSRPVSDLRK